MKIKVLFFARLKEIFGESSCWVEVPEGSCVRELLGYLTEPGAEYILKEFPLIFAVNEEFETDGRRLKDRDELALMMPMSGG